MPFYINGFVRAVTTKGNPLVCRKHARSTAKVEKCLIVSLELGKSNTEHATIYNEHGLQLGLDGARSKGMCVFFRRVHATLYCLVNFHIELL